MKFEMKYCLVSIIMVGVLLLSGCDSVQDEENKLGVNIKSLILTVVKTTLNKDENTTVKVVAEMKNGSQ